MIYKGKLENTTNKSSSLDFLQDTHERNGPLDTEPRDVPGGNGIILDDQGECYLQQTCRSISIQELLEIDTRHGPQRICWILRQDFSIH